MENHHKEVVAGISKSCDVFHYIKDYMSSIYGTIQSLHTLFCFMRSGIQNDFTHIFQVHFTTAETMVKNDQLVLTHWGRETHICFGKLTIIASDNGLLPGRRQAIIWTNAGTLLTGPLGTNFSEILIGIQTLSFKKIDLKMPSAKCRPFVSVSMCQANLKNICKKMT